MLPRGRALSFPHEHYGLQIPRLLRDPAMLRPIKRAMLQLLRGCGVFELAADSRWRQQRLLILCYHGTSLDDEHLWRPGLYISPEVLAQRLESLKKGGYSVVGLNDGLERLRSGSLPARSVAITFDDGTFDFYRQAYPLLKAFGFPVTVYQTTYYTEHTYPVFNLICSYMLWKHRSEVLRESPELGINHSPDLRTEPGRHKVVRSLIDFAERENMSGQQKDELAAKFARWLGVDYEQLKRKRILQLMNEQELRQIANDGFDIQLHTHRHRTPDDDRLFRREIRDNRERIQLWTGADANHFCYPSGVYRPEFLTRLREERIVSATTCDAGLATRSSDPLLLPRFVDTQGRTQTEFESWLSGIGDLLAFRRLAAQAYVPRDH
jgi:peptidoglycan/xylan/chitin deacetylase (PgdA/CDA1 family)